MVSDQEFQTFIDEALGSLSKIHTDHLKNVALLFADEPSTAQREQLQLRGDQTLLGLYEGIPLSHRQGMVVTLPDRITLFKKPLEMQAGGNVVRLKEEIRHTLWHEIAHYYGLNHQDIRGLE
jgi:predicted Zn-dependent protease with MMP-like domain